ncbi:MAG: hypothetical protein WBA99_11595 [Nodosilinea sp.]
MVKRHIPFQLALASFGLLSFGVLPSSAWSDQSSNVADLKARQAIAAQAETVGVVNREASTVNPASTAASEEPSSQIAPEVATVASSPSVDPAIAAEPDPVPAPSAYLTTAAALAAPSQPDRLPVLPGPGPAELAQADDDTQPLPQDPELGVIQLRSLLEDNDLGILRIRDQPQLPTQTAQPPAQIGFFSARLAIASSDNILLAVNDVGGLTSDTFLRPSIGFGVYPALGPRTAFIATADLGLQRYSAQAALNYDDLRFRVGLRQGLSPRSYGQLIATYQELYRPGGNRGRFFKNAALGLTLGRRDPITPKLALDSYYLVQFNDAESSSSGTVTDFSRILQSAGTYLGYDITPAIQLGLSYQLNLIDYTAQPRYDTFQQVLGQVVYRLSPSVRLNLYGGVSFGRSSEPRVRFNDTFFGAAIDATIPLF